MSKNALMKFLVWLISSYSRQQQVSKKNICRFTFLEPRTVYLSYEGDENCEKELLQLKPASANENGSLLIMGVGVVSYAVCLS